MNTKKQKDLSPFKDNPDEWIEANIGFILAWAQTTYKTTYEKEDMMQSAYLSVIMATSIVKEKNLKDQKSFRAAFFYCLRNNRPTGFYDTPFSALGDDDIIQTHAHRAGMDIDTTINSTLIDVLEAIWPQILAGVSKSDQEILTPMLGMGVHGQMSCREAAVILDAPKSTVARRTSAAIRRFRKHIIQSVPELR
jgi:hypothetical protein